MPSVGIVTMFSIFFIMLSCLVTQADAAALSLAYCYTDTSENSRWYKLLLIFATPSDRQQRRDVQVLFSCNFRNDPTFLHYQFRLRPCLLLTWTSECVVNVLFLCCHKKMQKVTKLTCLIQNKTSYFVQSKNYNRLIYSPFSSQLKVLTWYKMFERWNSRMRCRSKRNLKMLLVLSQQSQRKRTWNVKHLMWAITYWSPRMGLNWPLRCSEITYG